MSGDTSSVRVCVRLRPMNGREKANDTLPVVTASTDKAEVTLIRGSANRQQRQTYSFDSVFGILSEQKEVFTTISPLVLDVLNGFEATVFAYGQTGTGKTHTMEGDLKSEQHRGVIPRAVDAIFDQLENGQYTASSVSASYLEIYNEELSDLLSGETVAATPRDAARAPKTATENTLQLLEQPPTKPGGRGRAFVKNLSDHKVDTPSDVLALIARAQERRQVGETLMNKQSSRSHCVFTLTVSATRVTKDGAVMESTGKLHLVDLAGSECARTAAGDGPKQGAASDARERERKNINQSLLTLGRVISSLKERTERNNSTDNVRIPYRDSKLTRLLQESLGGRCKTVIIATLSPSVLAVDETFSTLNYAKQAHGIQNTPVATSYLKSGASSANMGVEIGDGKHSQDWSEMNARLASLQSEVEEAQSKLARKQMEQEALEKRADQAEKERAVALEQLEGEKAENEKLREQVETQSKELKVTGFLISTRERTEAKLSQQAHTLLESLDATEGEAAELHSGLAAAAASIDAQSARRLSFAASLQTQLDSAKSQMGALKASLNDERAKMLAAAESAEASLSGHANAVAANAAAMASAHEAELDRAKGALESAKGEASQAVADACASLCASLKNSSAQVNEAHSAIAAKLDGVSGAIDAAQAALGTTVDTAVGRQAATEEDAAANRAALASGVSSSASALVAKLGEEHARLTKHSAGLKALLHEMGQAKATEAKARSQLGGLKAKENADDEATRGKLADVTAAVAKAANSQQEKQQDGALSAKLAEAGGALDAMKGAASAALDAQSAALTAAVAAQNGGNAMGASVAALKDAQEAVEASANLRLEEMATAQSKLAAQQEGLRKMLSDLGTLRASVLEEVTSTLTKTLDAQLGKMAAKTLSSVEEACAVSKHVEGVGASAADGTKQHLASYSAKSDALVQMASAWGATNDDVASRMEAAIEAAVETSAGVASGASAVAAEHSAASGMVEAWAASDGECRDALSKANAMQSRAIEAAAMATAERVSSIDDLDATVVLLEEMSSAASEQVDAGRADIDAGAASVAEASKEHAAHAKAVVNDVDALGAASAAARKSEANALRAMAAAAAAASESAAKDLLHAKQHDAAAAKSHSDGAAQQVDATEGLAKANESRWASFAAAEATARDGAAALVRTKRDLASGEANLFANAVVSTREARQQAAANGEEAGSGGFDEQDASLGGMRSAVEHFVSDSMGDAAEVPERTPMPFEEKFASTAAETVLRSHYEEKGDVPYETYEVAALRSPRPTASRSRLMPAMTPKSAQGKRISIVDAAALHAMTNPQLKKLCEENELIQTGKKEELVARLAKMNIKAPSQLGLGGTPKSTPRRSMRQNSNDAEAVDNANAKEIAAAAAPNVVKQPSLTKQVSADGSKSAAPTKHNSISAKPGSRLAVKRPSARDIKAA